MNEMVKMMNWQISQETKGEGGGVFGYEVDDAV